MPTEQKDSEIHNPLAELEQKTEQAEAYYAACTAHWLKLREQLTKAGENKRAARRECDSMRRAVYALKQAGFRRG